jgi:hypothetical protein
VLAGAEPPSVQISIGAFVPPLSSLLQPKAVSNATAKPSKNKRRAVIAVLSSRASLAE